MSYQLYDANGYVADLCSGGGFHDLLSYLRATQDEEMQALAEKGFCYLEGGMREKLQALPEPQNASAASVVEVLKKHVGKCEDVLIISDGLTGDGETAE